MIGADDAYREETTTLLLYGHDTKTKLPTICLPNPKPTHPRPPGACIVARISAVSGVVWLVIGIENATQTLVAESHACDVDAESTANTTYQQRFQDGSNPMLVLAELLSVSFLKNS